MGEDIRAESQKDPIDPALKREDTIKKRQGKQKAEFLAALSKIPILESAYRRAGIDRSTYYRWRKDDQEFASAADEAGQCGIDIVTDKASMNIISKVNEGDMTASKYWINRQDKNKREKPSKGHVTFVLDV
jgi:hypothetical protein